MDPLQIDPLVLSELITRLTPRQIQIVGLLAQGRSNRDIATILSISRETVKWHVRKMFQKVGAENRIQLIVIYVVWRTTEPVTFSKG